MKKYESIFILDQQKYEDGGKSFIENYKSAIIELAGEVDEVNDMGIRQLAHPIKKQPTAIYWDVVFRLDPIRIAELKDKYRLDETVMRYVIFNYDRPAVIKTPTQIKESSLPATNSAVEA